MPEWKSIIIFLIIILSSPASKISGKEKILSFHSSITISEDASMFVTETITVKAEGNKIKRGIFRDFPTGYKDTYGNSYNVGFEVTEVLRNGSTDEYRVENLSNGKRVYIGNKDIFIRPGIYTYEISYRTNRQLGFFNNHDELYWNVTGNGWDFDIEKVTAEVHLPKNISSNEITCFAFTGPVGSRGRDFMAAKSISGAGFSTTRVLGANEGLTIVIEWPKGYIAEPTSQMKFNYFLRDNKNVLAGLSGFVIIFIFYLIAWMKAGKDPDKGTIFPLYTPPDKFSPAAMRFIKKMGFDNKAFAASIINMAVKGYLSIKESEGKFTLVKGEAGISVLSPEEKRIASKLTFSSGGSSINYGELLNQIQNNIPFKNFFTKKIFQVVSSNIPKTGESNYVENEPVKILEVDRKNHTIFSSAIKELKKGLKNNYEKIFFLTNRKLFFIGASVSVMFIILMGVLGNSDQSFMIIWLSMWSVGVTFLITTVYKTWLSFASGGKFKISGIISALFITAFSIPFVAGELAGIYFLTLSGSFLTPVLLAAIILINILFYHLLKAPTLAGRKLLDKIDGFKMYLSVTEKERLNFFNSPEKTPELFEKYLPYALALDVENEWAEQFASVFNSAAVEKNSYHPHWYSGPNWNSFNTAGFAASLGSSFSNAISSSSTAPGSGSGSSGSSGGGGGGGGGGGW